MKIEVGQWVRTRRGKIFQNKNFSNLDERLIKAIANTPQELVQVRDLVEVIGFDFGTRKIANKYELKWLKENKDKITKILTPNSNGGYDLQWSDEK